MEKIKLGIPKGSLQEATLKLFKKAGFNISVSERSYRPSIDSDSIECVLLRAQEIPKYVAMGALDAGLSGKDLIEEAGADVTEIVDLNYSKTGFGKVKLVIAVPEGSGIKSIKDLEGKRIATELVNVTNAYLKKNNVKADVEFSWGATEAKLPELADAIADLTETGSSLKANKLRIVDTVIESTTRFIANKDSLKTPWKKKVIDEIALLLKGALAAESKVGLKMNVEVKNLEGLLSLLPALKSPTVTELSDKKWAAVETILDEKVVREIIPKLKKAGAQGLVEYSLNKIIE